MKGLEKLKCFILTNKGGPVPLLLFINRRNHVATSLRCFIMQNKIDVGAASVGRFIFRYETDLVETLAKCFRFRIPEK